MSALFECKYKPATLCDPSVLRPVCRIRKILCWRDFLGATPQRESSAVANSFRQIDFFAGKLVPNAGGCGFKISGQGHGPGGKQNVFRLDLEVCSFLRRFQTISISQALLHSFIQYVTMFRLIRSSWGRPINPGYPQPWRTLPKAGPSISSILPAWSGSRNLFNFFNLFSQGDSPLMHIPLCF